jgi:hypothetical protein
MHPWHASAALAGVLLLACGRRGEQQPTIRDLDPRPVAADSDPVNRQTEAAVDGLVLTVTIDSASITLDTAVLAKIPPSAATRGSGGTGDRVTAVGLAAGSRVSQASAPDGVLNVQEGVGLVRMTKRQVVLSLPAPRALDVVEVSAPATGATARLDVRAAYAQYCKKYNADNKYCPSPQKR